MTFFPSTSNKSNAFIIAALSSVLPSNVMRLSSLTKDKPDKTRFYEAASVIYLFIFSEEPEKRLVAVKLE